MNETRIRALLHAADRSAGPPPATRPGLADRVRTLHARRHRTRVMASGAVAALVALGIGVGAFVAGYTGRSVTRDRPAPLARLDEGPVGTRARLDQLQAQIRELRAEADAALALVRHMAALQEQQRRLAELRRASGGADPLEDVRQHMEKAAFTILYQADRAYRELNLPDAAVESYRRVIALFPDTPSAAVARQRLSDIEAPKGDKL